MARIITERAYIEPFDGENNDFQILIHIKDDENHIFAGKIELDRNIPWIHLETAENGDLEISHSAGMENNKWDHITEYILGDINE